MLKIEKYHLPVQRFLTSESGAVTVDWVVLTAMIVGLGLAITILITGNIKTTSEMIGDTVSSASTAVPSIIGESS